MFVFVIWTLKRMHTCINSPIFISNNPYEHLCHAHINIEYVSWIYVSHKSHIVCCMFVTSYMNVIINQVLADSAGIGICKNLPIILNVSFLDSKLRLLSNTTGFDISKINNRLQFQRATRSFWYILSNITFSFIRLVIP